MHPLIYLVIEVATTCGVVGFTAPKSFARKAGLAVVVWCVWRCISRCMFSMVRTPWAALVGGYAVTYLYHYLDVALISQWDFEQAAPVGSFAKSSYEQQRADSNENKIYSIWQRLHFGVKVTSSFRFIGTPYQVKSVPLAITTERRHFLLRTSLVIITSHIILDAISSSNDPDIASKYLMPENIKILARLNEITTKELMIRACTVIASCIGLNCVQGGIYHLFALVAVSLDISRPEDWPPFYGSITQAWTIRRFWNKFWHQMNARKYASISHFVVYKVLHLQRGSKSARILLVLTAFMTSGLMHLLIDISAGIPAQRSGAINFFSAQVLGILVEGAIISAYGASSKRIPRFLEVAVGFIWTFAFLVWSAPAYVYPMFWRTNEGFNDSTIPFSIFGSKDERMVAFGCIMLICSIAIVGSL